MGRKRTPTRRITNFEFGDIENTLERILQRHLTVDPFPLEAEDLIKLWTADMGAEELAAWNALRAWRDAVPPDGEELFHKVIRGARYAAIPLILHDGARLCFEFPRRLIENTANMGNIMWERTGSKFLNLSSILSIEKESALDAWMRRDIHTHYLVNRSRVVLMDVCRAANTVGQLHRMAPELVRYTSKYTQKAMETQERQSALPDAWMNVDREKLRLAQNHLGLCFLMPVNESGEDMPHAWTRSTAYSHSNYSCRLGSEMIEKLSVYTVPLREDLSSIGYFSEKG